MTIQSKLLLGFMLTSVGLTGLAQDVPGSAQEISPLLVGAQIPEVRFKTEAGEDFDLKQAVSQKPSILIFYRGGW